MGSGDLERAVMQALWSAGAPATARDVLDALPNTDLAITTVLTVLDRLRRKGMVERERDGRAFRYRAVQTREEHLAELMADALGQATDRAAVLTGFLGRVGDEDAGQLRRLLRRGPR